MEKNICKICGFGKNRLVKFVFMNNNVIEEHLANFCDKCEKIRGIEKHEITK